MSEDSIELLMSLMSWLIWSSSLATGSIVGWSVGEANEEPAPDAPLPPPGALGLAVGVVARRPPQALKAMATSNAAATQATVRARCRFKEVSLPLGQ